MPTNNVALIKLSAKATTKLDLVKKVVSTAIYFWGLTIEEMALSDTELNVLSYFIVYGVNNTCKDLIVKAKICKNIANINTIMVKLKRLKLIFKDELNGKNYVCKQLTFDQTPKVCMIFKIENQ